MPKIIIKNGKHLMEYKVKKVPDRETYLQKVTEDTFHIGLIFDLVDGGYLCIGKDLVLNSQIQFIP